MTKPLPAPPRPLWRRALLWAALVALLLVALGLLVVLTVREEHSRRQEESEAVAAEAVAQVRRNLLSAVAAVQGLAQRDGNDWPAQAEQLLARPAGPLRLEQRDSRRRVLAVSDGTQAPRLFEQMMRSELANDIDLLCSRALRTAAPTFSPSYFVPLSAGVGMELIDLCVPARSVADGGFVVATFGLAHQLDAAAQSPALRGHEFSFVEADGTRLARSGSARGQGVFVGERLLDLPGTVLQLRADSMRGRPSLLPSLNVSLVVVLSLALLGLVAVLARDMRRRARAEQGLAEALAFRKAMEDSLSTGLRARDLDGAVRYVNPAFESMVGFSAEELRQEPPPYWPPEHRQTYAARQRERQRSDGARSADAREGFETVFMRKNGERFPVMIYEAPLVDGEGRQSGWMSAVVDISAQRRVEEISRQQQDRLQATARLATVGEMASLLSHELNQPLAAIASYASGSLNLLAPQTPDDDLRQQLGQALTRIAEQAERAGRVIRSVHDFVRRREHLRECVAVTALLEAVLPLVRLQARKSDTQLVVDLPEEALHVECDRTMVEQVLLNLTRNAIQAMEGQTPPAERVLTLRVRQAQPRWVHFSIVDAGSGIPPEAAARLFTPFFTTRAEGMGLGLSLCRTVIEQHGGALDFRSPLAGGRGTEFRFTLAAA